ncbi:hypothetical protein [Streptomyces sp. NPDC093225]|uniref:hypothetical protein n=1 Tax=Streptomyces sp. NPDC093225 TaxID=3366034 RepID=UPI003817C30A
MFARRPLLTAIGAGTLLTALWFVPNANATPEQPAAAPRSADSASVRTATVGVARVTGTAKVTGATGAIPAAAPADAPTELALADTGGVDTSPYLLAGTAFLVAGAGFVAFSARRARAEQPGRP